MSDLWDRSDRWVSEYADAPLTDDLLAEVERKLGYKLPAAYVDLCRLQNGGRVLRPCYRISGLPGWGDHVQIGIVRGIGFANDWSLCGSLGQENSFEWGYPPLGVYFADTLSGGHDLLCLDYSTPNDQGGPRVVHVDQEDDFRVTFVADSFETFIAGLEEKDAFQTNDDLSPPPSFSSRLRDGFVDFADRYPRAFYWISFLTPLLVVAGVYFFTHRVSQ